MSSGGSREDRDSKDPGGPMLRFTPGAWGAFRAVVAGGGSGRP
ncbi:DUF397 domain-containing protein [Streptomyces sp. SYSU K217416]